MGKIDTLDWFITSKCNDSCGFCYAPLEFIDSDKTEEFYYSLCDRIKRIGFSRVGLCGGEPTLFPYLDEIVKYMHSIQLEVSLYTNLCQSKRVLDLVEYVYALSIPLDSINYIEGMRNSRHFEHVAKFFENLKEINSKKPLIKVGTVVTAKNIDEIEKIGKFLANQNCVDVWKLYQYSPGGKCKDNADSYLINDKDFNSAVEACKKSVNSLQIIPRTREQTNKYCVLMNQVGEFYYYNEDYFSTGANIFSNSKEEITEVYNASINIVQKDWVKNDKNR